MYSMYAVSVRYMYMYVLYAVLVYTCNDFLYMYINL